MTKFRKICESIYELEPASSRRILTMEGMRGVAVLLVFFVHYHALFGRQLAAQSFTFRLSSFLECIGHSGVDLFFVLSGYLIYSILMKGRVDLSKFITRRIKRIYPTFLCVFAIYLALSAVFPQENKIPGGAAAAGAYLIQNVLLLPGIFEIRPLITVSWSLSYEFFFYFTLPLVIAAAGLRSWRPSRRVLFFAGVAISLIALNFAGMFSRLQIILFLAGILVYEATAARNGTERRIARADLLGILAVVVAFALVYLLLVQPSFLRALPTLTTKAWTYREIVLTAAFFTLFLCSLSAGSILKHALSWTPLRWLGNMSYSYYLIHGLTLKGVALLVQRTFGGEHALLVYWLGMPLFFAATWAVSTVLFVMVEKRFSFAKKAPRTVPANAVPVPVQG